MRAYRLGAPRSWTHCADWVFWDKPVAAVVITGGDLVETHQSRRVWYRAVRVTGVRGCRYVNPIGLMVKSYALSS